MARGKLCCFYIIWRDFDRNVDCAAFVPSSVYSRIAFILSTNTDTNGGFRRYKRLQRQQRAVSTPCHILSATTLW
jgi:hypothetical protein